MTDILCKWLNDELHLSQQISQATFAQDFASGYLLGEVLRKHQLQDDFDQFSQSKTSDSKINNFTRLEPMFQLLGIPFDTNVARNVMTEKHGAATRLLYQMYIALNNKKKANLTGIAMETFQPPANVKLGVVEGGIYRERLKQATPRQTDLNLQVLVNRFQQNQVKMEKAAFKKRFDEAEQLYQKRMCERQALLDKSRKMREKQSELAAKINTATVNIPKPPANLTLKAIRARQDAKRKKEAEETIRSIYDFEGKIKMIMPPAEEGDDIDLEYILTRNEDRGMPAPTLNPAENDEYIGKIRKRLQEDALAREEREKRRRKVLGDQMLAHQNQEEAKREEMMVNRLMRLSQLERRIAVQLLQARHEKEVIRQNRLLREKQYKERRIRDFDDALNREVALVSLYKREYAEQIRINQELHDVLAAQRIENRYYRHYLICAEIVNSIIDFACKVTEYRELTSNFLPAKLMREWKLLFTSGEPLYEYVKPEVIELTPEQILEEDRQQLLDEGDFLEYKTMNGEWQPPERCVIEGPPRDNPVVGHVVQRLFNMVNPPSPPPLQPEFPSCPLRVCLLGKAFSGKSTCAQCLAKKYHLYVLVPKILVQEAIDAHEAGEVETAEQGAQADLDNEESLSNSTLFDQDTEGHSESVVHEDMQADIISEIVNEVAKASAQNNADVAPEQDSVKDGEEPENKASIIQQNSTVVMETPSAIKRKANRPEPTVRAKLGSKAMKCLRKGQPVDDQIVVDLIVEAIKKIPEKSGWILDGYPQKYIQAKLLEKALSGFDRDAKKNLKKDSKVMRKSSLAPDPRPPPPPVDPPSGIDVVILFDIRDELCLRRSTGRTEQVQAQKSYHEEYNPPPQGSRTGLDKTEKVQPVSDPSNDQQQIQNRIIGFLEQWPKLEKWFTRFGTLRTVDASLENESVFLETEIILEDISAKMHNKGKEGEKVPEVAAAAEAGAPGAPPEGQTEPAAEEPAPGGPEIQAVQSGSRAEGGEGKKMESESGETGDKVPSGSGEKSSSAATSIKIGPDGKPLSESKQGSEEAEASGSKQGSGSKAEAEEKPTEEPDVEFNVVIKIDAPLGSEQSTGGSSSREKKSKSPKGKKSESGSSKSRGSRGISPKASKNKASKVKTPEPEPVLEMLPVLEPPKPGDEGWTFADMDIDQELAKVLVLQWEEMEKAYVNNCKKVFRNIRFERENIYRYFFQIKKDYSQFLKRPDCKQDFIDPWQKHYNEVPDDMRDDEEIKAELHNQVDDLVERLWHICDERKEQAEAERMAIIFDGWLEDRLGFLTNHYLTLMQAELDRLQDTVRMLKDYHRGMLGFFPDALNPDYERIPLVELPLNKKEKTPDHTIGDVNHIIDSEKQHSVSMSPKAGMQSKSPKPDSSKSPKGSKSSLDGSAKKKKDLKDVGQPESQIIIPIVPERLVHRIIIPLVPHHPTTPEEEIFKVHSTLKEKKSLRKVGEESVTASEESAVLPHTQDDKLVINAYTFAANAISLIIQAEMKVKDEEEEAERQKNQDKDKEKGKGKKGEGGGKKGKTSPKKNAKASILEPSFLPIATVISEVSEEEKQKKLLKANAKKEYYFSIQEEVLHPTADNACRLEYIEKARKLKETFREAAIIRLELIHLVACAVLQDLKTKGEETFKLMNDWLGDRFLKEMNGIDHMAEVMCAAIERGEQIKYDLCLQQDDFLLDEDIKVLKTPSPEPPGTPVEQPMLDNFTVDQLMALYYQGKRESELPEIREISGFGKMFRTTAPNGIISKKAFVDMFENLVSVTHGMESLPDTWMNMTVDQIIELGKALSAESDYVDYRRLLVALCFPIPIPSQQQLLDTVVQFKAMDQRSISAVTREQWYRMKLWFTPEQVIVDEFDRLTNLQRALFEIFADHSGSLSLLNYESFLMYFSASANYYEGFLRALSVAMGYHMPHLDKPSLQSSTNLEMAAGASDNIEGPEGREYVKLNSEPPMSDEVIPPEANDAVVSVEALYRTLHHGEIYKGDSHRFNVTADLEDHTSIERLGMVFQELNDDDTTAPIMYRILIEHPLIQDVVVACKQFKALDVRAFMSGPIIEGAEIASSKSVDSVQQ